MLEAVGAGTDHGHDGLVAFGEARIRFGGPLHGSAGAVAFRQFEVIAHGDLVSVTNDRGARQRHHETVSKLQPPAITLEHWG